MKRVILVMSLVLIYSCAFMFVKVYAEKSIISGDIPVEEPPPAEIRAAVTKPAETEAAESDELSTEPMVTQAPQSETDLVSEPVEYIVNKPFAAAYPVRESGQAAR